MKLAAVAPSLAAKKMHFVAKCGMTSSAKAANTCGRVGASSSVVY